MIRVIAQQGFDTAAQIDAGRTLFFYVQRLEPATPHSADVKLSVRRAAEPLSFLRLERLMFTKGRVFL